MNAKRILFIGLLLTAALTLGLSAAAAQDAPPAKGQPRAAGIIRDETALAANQALPPVWESEPNNTRDTADWLSERGSFAVQVSGVIGAPGDVDYYEFYGIPGDVVNVTTAADLYGSAVDTVVTLYGVDGRRLTDNDDCYDDLDSCLSYTLTSEGEYTLIVEDYYGVEGGPGFWYDLFVWMPVRDNEEWYRYGPGGEEPNNTRAQATGVSYGRTLPWTQMDYAGDIDFFKFEGAAGDRVRIRVETTGLRNSLRTQLSLYNSAGALLASCARATWLPGTSNCFLEKTLPKAGVYYVRVSDDQQVEVDTNYWLQIGIVEPTEPNDTLAQAVAISYGQTVNGLVSEGDISDFYRFYGYQGDYVTLLGVGLGLDVYNQNGDYLSSNFEDWGLPLSFSLPATGWYYAEVYAYAYLDSVPVHFGDYHLTIDRMMLAGVKTNGVAGGLTYNKSDILAWLPGSNGWAMFFDGSDVGVTTNLQDFDVVQLRYERADWPDYLLMTLGTNARLQGRPDYFTAAPQDVVKFMPSDLGQSTWGRWEMYLDGSDIGLTTLAETIDAVDLQQSEYEYLILSTTGRATVIPSGGGAPFSAEDEDLFVCGAPPGGWNTITFCRLYFDGSAAGLPAAADIASVWIEPASGEIYMTFAAATTVNGVVYKPSDVAVCRPNNFTMPLTSCTWLPKFWTGSAHGMAGKYVDGLAVALKRPN